MANRRIFVDVGIVARAEATASTAMLAAARRRRRDEG